MTNIYRIVVMLVFAILLVGCSSNSTATTTPVPSVNTTNTQSPTTAAVIPTNTALAESAASSDEPSEIESYPVSTPLPVAIVEESYPDGTPAPKVPPTPIISYPAPTAVVAATGTLISFNRPINEGDTNLSGVGPAGLEIFIVNVTFMGEEISSTKINNDGAFSLDVPPMPSGVRIGLSADIVNLGLSASDIIAGEGAFNAPDVGFFYDSIVILQ